MAVAHELDVNTDDPKKAVHAVKERVRKAKLKFPGGAAAATAAPAGGVDKVGTNKASPTKPRMAAGSKASTPKKGAKKPIKEEEEAEGAAAEA